MASDTDESRRASQSGLRVVGSVPPPPAPPSEGSPRSSRYGAGNVIADKYRLVRKLGEGGMGEVWLAHNATLEIDVAIKLIRGEVATDDMADRLLQEARAAARLGHPSIVRINDFGKTDHGDPFLVMELLEGEDLASALVQRGRLSAQKAVRTLLPIAHALAAAHTKGIVHRDIKPENIFLSRGDDGQLQPKLVDFGVAKLEKPHSGRLTQSGALLGSPLYMSPEQARGDDVDHRADVWALGVVLYEATSGRPPFEGKNYNAILYSIIANPPTPLTDFGVGDAELWSIVECALQKDPDRRWYSMREFGEALARWLEDRDIHDDVAGGSLKATWLSWKKDEDALGAGPSSPPPSESMPGALPPPPMLAESPPSRERIITVRRPRPRKGPVVLVSAVAALIIALLAFAAVRSVEHVQEPGRALASPAAEAPPVQEAAEEQEVTEGAEPASPEHERAIRDAIDTGQAAATNKGNERARAASGAARPMPKSPSAGPQPAGIHKADPYGAGAPQGASRTKLKDPFR